MRVTPGGDEGVKVGGRIGGEELHTSWSGERQPETIRAMIMAGIKAGLMCLYR